MTTAEYLSLYLVANMIWIVWHWKTMPDNMKLTAKIWFAVSLVFVLIVLWNLGVRLYVS